jgi:arsenite methyltransferase
MTKNNKIKDSVKEYYGETLQTSEDLKTSACSITGIPDDLKKLISNVHDEVSEKFYGCGSPIPPILEGMTILDLGCGTGRDCYVLSQLVGESGKVIGVDMTDNQLEVANRHIDYHMKKFGYKKPNIEFKKGYIENLQELNLEDDSIDIVISNCVINLSPNKEDVFTEIFRVLKTGGELYFSDIFADRRIPEELKDDKVLVGECLGGALYIEDFRRIINNVGCADYRVVESASVSLDKGVIEQKLGMVEFRSLTVRAFKIDFEDICENYGHVAYYLGTIKNSPHEFNLDNHHKFKKGLPLPICGNTTKMLSETRYKNHFKIIGDFSTHYGKFDCDPETSIQKSDSELEVGCC